MAIEVVNPGFLTTIQDQGRRGRAAEGWRECGACDEWAARTANLMAGNGPEAAVIETTAVGITLRFRESCVTAFSGVEAEGTIRGAAAPMNTPIRAEAGDTLEIRIRRGLRACAAVRGGILTPEVLGSRSTDLICHVGGMEGRCLRPGDVLPCGESPAESFEKLRRRAELWSRFRPVRHPAAGQADTAVIHLTRGPEAELFSEEALEALTGNVYTVDETSNRMGLRLTGKAVASLSGKTDILSGAVVSGTVQIPASGQPIIMLCDHQTTGGYARIGTVSPVDLPLLAQLRPGEGLRFSWIRPEEALKAWRKRERSWRRMYAFLNR